MRLRVVALILAFGVLAFALFLAVWPFNASLNYGKGLGPLPSFECGSPVKAAFADSSAEGTWFNYAPNGDAVATGDTAPLCVDPARWRLVWAALVAVAGLGGAAWAGVGLLSARRGRVAVGSPT